MKHPCKKTFKNRGKIGPQMTSNRSKGTPNSSETDVRQASGHRWMPRGRFGVVSEGQGSASGVSGGRPGPPRCKFRPIWGPKWTSKSTKNRLKIGSVFGTFPQGRFEAKKLKKVSQNWTNIDKTSDKHLIQFGVEFSADFLSIFIRFLD